MYMSNFDFTDLILLVGTNPLPNYVVGKYFLEELEKGNFKEGSKLQKIWLVCTKETKDFASQLIKQLEISQVKIALKQLSDPSDPIIIARDFGSLLDEINKENPNSKIHINYTGGTKAMSVHAVKTALIPLLKKELSASLNIEACFDKINEQFSYLDARKFKIKNDKGDLLVDNLLEKSEVSIGLERLVELHKLKRANIDDGLKDKTNDSSKVLIELIEGGFVDLKKISIYKGSIEDLSISKLRDYILNPQNSISEESKKIVKTLPLEYQVFDDSGNYSLNSNLTVEKAKELVEYCNGKWLEHYIYNILKKELQLDTYINWEIHSDNWPKNKANDGKFLIQFELDVLLIRGYQLIGISCTTGSARQEAKMKGMEMLQRSKQIGGDEAKTILITGMKGDNDVNQKPEFLQKELEIDTGGSGNILVLGIKDLKKEILVDKIKKFIGIS